jgi:hypothetical protein
MCSRDDCPSAATFGNASTSRVHHGPASPRTVDRLFRDRLYVAVDKYEPDRTFAFVLKCLVVMWGGAAVIHCTGLFGAGFF